MEDLQQDILETFKKTGKLIYGEHRLYTKEELLKAVEYACGYQKASDYQMAGHHLIEDVVTDEHCANLLDELHNTDKNSASEISIEDMHEYLES